MIGILGRWWALSRPAGRRGVDWGHWARRMTLALALGLLLGACQAKSSEGVVAHDYWIGDLLEERISLPAGNTAIGPSALPSCIGDEELRAWRGGVKWRLFETAEDCAKHLELVGAVTGGTCRPFNTCYVKVEGGVADHGRVVACLRMLRSALRSSVTRDEDPRSFAYVESDDPVKFLQDAPDR